MTDQQPAWQFTAAPVDPDTERAALARIAEHEAASAKGAEFLAKHSQPTESGSRHTVDTLTSDDLDRLYARIETLEHVARSNLRHVQAIVPDLEDATQRAEQLEDLLRIANDTSNRSETERARAVERAERAEAAIERVRAYAHELRHKDAMGLLAALDEHQEQPATVERQPATEQLVHIGWWCWRGDNHGHLVTSPCRSDNVPLHAPTEWADDMRAVIQRIEDGDDEEEQP